MHCCSKRGKNLRYLHYAKIFSHLQVPSIAHGRYSYEVYSIGASYFINRGNIYALRYSEYTEITYITANKDLEKTQGDEFSVRTVYLKLCALLHECERSNSRKYGCFTLSQTYKIIIFMIFFIILA